MKKLLLVTGILLSLSLMVSAQQKKSTAPATTTQTPQKKKTIKDVQTDLKAEKTAEKMKRGEAKKKTSSSPASKETKSN